MAKETPHSGSKRTRWTLGSIGAVLIAIAAAWFGLDEAGDSRPSPTTASSNSDKTCSLGTLPDEAGHVVEDILTGGPFVYPENDGTHFGNYEGLLPEEHNDYYREYTVDTPGLDHRGARRLVTGGETETDPETWYYTSDHYESFCEIPDVE